MIEEEALAHVQTCDLRHICFTEGKVKDIKILLHTLDMRRFRNDYNITHPSRGMPLFTLGRSYLINTVSDLWHLYAVVQYNIFHF